MKTDWHLLPNYYLFRPDHLSPLNIDQLAHSILNGVELPAVAGCIEAVSISLSKEKEKNIKQRLLTNQIQELSCCVIKAVSYIAG